MFFGALFVYFAQCAEEAARVRPVEVVSAAAGPIETSR
jgi:hypothetical protein